MKRLIIVRGGGEIAAGVAIYLYRAGFRVLVLETSEPTSIRREMSFADAVYDGEKTVERVTCYRADDMDTVKKRLKQGDMVLYVDAEARAAAELSPMVLVDAIMADRNCGTTRSMAKHTIGLGPGFCAGRDVDAVIETMRGYNLGRIVYDGYTRKTPDEPSQVGNDNRVEDIMYAPVSGKVELLRQISYAVKKGEVFAKIHTSNGEEVLVEAAMDGILRGTTRNGSLIAAGDEIADINPNLGHSQCFRMSDKVRCIAGAVLETVMIWKSAEKRRLFS